MLVLPRTSAPSIRKAAARASPSGLWAGRPSVGRELSVKLTYPTINTVSTPHYRSSHLGSVRFKGQTCLTLTKCCTFGTYRRCARSAQAQLWVVLPPSHSTHPSAHSTHNADTTRHQQHHKRSIHPHPQPSSEISHQHPHHRPHRHPLPPPMVRLPRPNRRRTARRSSSSNDSAQPHQHLQRTSTSS